MQADFGKGNKPELPLAVALTREYAGFINILGYSSERFATALAWQRQERFYKQKTQSIPKTFLKQVSRRKELWVQRPTFRWESSNPFVDLGFQDILSYKGKLKVDWPSADYLRAWQCSRCMMDGMSEPLWTRI